VSRVDILLVRHPETEANVTGRYVGRGDAPLTDIGREQAVRLVGEIADWAPDALWSSPLPRAFDVAQAAGGRLGLDVTVDDRLTELDFGDAEGLTYGETVERGIAFQFKSEDEPVAPEGESRRDILMRTSSVLADVIDATPRACIVTHGGVFRSAMVELLGLPISEIWTFHIRNAQLADIAMIEGHGRLERFFQV
jgi:alpha-ribazole phosphatase